MTKIREKKIDEAIFDLIKRKLFIGNLSWYANFRQVKYRGWLHRGVRFSRKNEVIKFEKSNTNGNKIPHIGFNSVKFDRNKLFKDLNNNLDFYFVHSYFMQTKGLKKNISTTNYGIDFLSSFNIEKYFGNTISSRKKSKKRFNAFKKFFKLSLKYTID